MRFVWVLRDELDCEHGRVYGDMVLLHDLAMVMMSQGYKVHVDLEVESIG